MSSQTVGLFRGHTKQHTHTECLIKNLFSYLSLGLFIVHDYSGGGGDGRGRQRGSRGSQVRV